MDFLENLRFFFRNGKSQFVVHWESRPSAFWPGKSICPSAGHLQWPTGLVAPLVMPAVSGVGDKEVIKRWRGDDAESDGNDVTTTDASWNSLAQTLRVRHAIDLTSILMVRVVQGAAPLQLCLLVTPPLNDISTSSGVNLNVEPT